MSNSELEEFLSWAAETERWIHLSYLAGENLEVRVKPLVLERDMVIVTSRLGNLGIKLYEITSIEGVELAALSLEEAMKPRPHPSSVKARRGFERQAEQFVQDLWAGLISAEDFKKPGKGN